MDTRQSARQAARRRSGRALRGHSGPRKILYSRTLRYEPLEDRRLLALVTVDTPLDTVDLDDDLTSLREAIFATNLVSGPDEIRFDFGHDGPETIVLTKGELRISDDLTITGPGANFLTIDASGNDATPDIDDGQGSRIFNLNDATEAFINVSVAGLTLTGGDVTGDGGAILAYEAVYIDKVNIVANAAGSGGGVAAVSAQVSISKSNLKDNVARNSSSSLMPVGGGGGAYILRGTAVLSESTLSGNRALIRGGGIFSHNATTTLSNCSIVDNFANRFGGGLDGIGGQVSVNASIVSDNSLNPSSGLRGAGIRFSVGSLNVTDSVVSGNRFAISGGGINSSGTLTVKRSTISDHTVPGTGGGIFSFSGLTMTDSSIVNNSAAEAGGLAVQREFTIHSSTISDNSGLVTVGGVLLIGGEGTITLSSIVNNFGGGLFVGSLSNVEASLTHVIVARNNLHTGPDRDIRIGLGAINASSSLIGYTDASGFAEAPVGSPDANGNLIGGPVHGEIDPVLGPLANNGGPTMTHALLPGSPAINAGDLNAKAGEGGVPLYDQRGEPFSRVVNGRIDIGAFEYQAPSDLNLLVDTLEDETDGNHGRRDLSLREAIQLANLYPSDDTIRFDTDLTAAGPATILLTKGELRITDDVAIEGPGSELLTVDASGNDPTPHLDNGDGSRVFNIDGNAFGIQFHVAMTGIRIIGGDVTGDGGGIRSMRNLMISEVMLSDNASSSRGGGLFADGDAVRVVIADVSAVNNRALDGGGMALDSNNTSQMFVTRAMVENNTAQSRAGGIYALAGGSVGAAVISIASTTASHNFSGRHSGGGYFEANSNGNISASDCNFSDNESLGSGGGLLVFVANSMGTATINRSTFVDNVSNGNGGGLVLSNHLHGTITLSDATVSGNSAANRGGGIAVSHNNDYRTTTITTFLEGLRVTDNTSQGEGGGISFVGSNGGGKLSLSRSTITGNSAALDGGGIHLYNSHTSQGSAASADEILLADNLIANNFADRDGGGLFASTKVSVQGSRGSLTIDRNTIYLNSASNGGGIYLHADTAVAQVGKVSQIISDSTVSSNLATRLGGGLYIGQQNLGSVDVNRSTVANNRSYLAGGGIFVTNGTLSMSHVIVATNGSPTGLDLAVILGATLSPRFSLIGSNDHSGLAESPVGSADANGNLIGGSTNGFINPRIGPPVKNGGALPTHALRPGSPAINAGDPAAMAGVGGVPQFDQRGAPYVRVHGGRIDIGAFESQPVLLTGDYNFNGVVDAADVIIWRNTRLSSIDLRADGNGDGVVNQADWQVWRSNFGRTAESVEQGSGSEEREAENTEPEATGAPPPRPAWQPPASPGVSVATSRPAFRPATQRCAPQDDLLAAIASPLAAIQGQYNSDPARRQSIRHPIVDPAAPNFRAIDLAFETLARM